MILQVLVPQVLYLHGHPLAWFWPPVIPCNLRIGDAANHWGAACFDIQSKLQKEQCLGCLKEYPQEQAILTPEGSFLVSGNGTQAILRKIQGEIF